MIRSRTALCTAARTCKCRLRSVLREELDAGCSNLHKTNQYSRRHYIVILGRCWNFLQVPSYSGSIRSVTGLSVLAWPLQNDFELPKQQQILFCGQEGFDLDLGPHKLCQLLP